MRETGFIEQNKEKWEEFEKILKEKERDPDAMSDLFIQITDDLSYSRTFYPNRSVRVYLNHLAQQVFSNIYKARKLKPGAFLRFWSEELPQILYHSQRELLISFVIFGLSMAIGIISSIYDPEFAQVILGDRYVQMTETNIEGGDPMAVYKDRDQLNMFLSITWNNIRVAFFCFVLGALFSLGTIYILVSNGIMVGAFQFFFIERDLFRESFLTIWAHGTLEISSIVVAGAAGLVMGRGLVFPGTYNRIQSFQVSAMRGIKIMIGLVPIFIMAGFIEGFITRYTETPDILRAALILVSISFMLWYFVFYPIFKARAGFKRPLPNVKVPPNTDFAMDFQAIRTNGELFSDAFQVFRKYSGATLRTALVLATGYTAFSYFFFPEQLSFTTYYSDDFEQYMELFFGYYGELSSLFDYNNQVLLLPLGFLLMVVMAFQAGLQVRREREGVPGKRIGWKAVLNHFRKRGVGLILLAGIVNLFLYLPGWGWNLALLLLIPTCTCVAAAVQQGEDRVFPLISRGFSLFGKEFGRWIGLFVTFLFVCMLILGFLGSDIMIFLFESIKSFVLLDEDALQTFYQLFYTWNAAFGLSMVFYLINVGMNLLYYSVQEQTEATDLKARIADIGNKRTVYGIRQVE